MNQSWKPSTVEDLMCYWLLTYANAYKAPSSVRRDEGMIRRQILPYFKAKLLSEIETRDVELWLLELRDGTGLSEKSCNDVLGLFRKTLVDAIRWGFMSENPVAKVRKFKLPEQKYQYWNVDQVKRYLLYFNNQKLKPRGYWHVLFALYTGMRRGELIALRWDRVDLNSNIVTVDRAYCRVLGTDKNYTKSGKIRYVPICSSLAKVLEVLKKSDSVEQKVLPALPVDMINIEFAKQCKQCGNPLIKFHDLRHTFASNFLAGGGKIYDLQKILGHSTIQVTERYVHMDPKELRGKTEVLGF